MKNFIANVLACVICFAVFTPIIHWLFVFVGWSEPRPFLSNVAEGAGMGLLFGLVTSIYNLIKKK